MSLRQSLFRHLQTVARGVFPGADAYPMAALPKKPPFHYITFRRISSEHARHMLGGSGITRDRWQVDCWARSAADADQLFEAVRRSMDNLDGEFGDAGNLIKVNISLEGDSEEFEPPIDSSQIGRARVRADLMIWHPETVTPG